MHFSTVGDLASASSTVALRANASPRHDENFDVAGVRESIAAAEPVYKRFGANRWLRVMYPDCGHDFPYEARQAAYALLDECLTDSAVRSQR